MEPMTPAEQALDDRIQHIRAKYRGNTSTEMAVDRLSRQIRITNIVIAIVGTIIAIETWAAAILRIWYDL